MAKILKVKVITTPGAALGELMYEFPPEFDSGKISIIMHESCINKTQRAIVVERAVDINGTMTSVEYLIGAVKDVDAPAFLASPDIVEITSEEAHTLGEEWMPPVITVQDPIVVLTVLEKYRTGGIPTVDELKAIDPDDATRGVNKKTYNSRHAFNIDKIIASEA